jgi:hypothetical protein
LCIKPDAMRAIGIYCQTASAGNPHQRARSTTRHDGEEFVQAVLAGGRSGMNEVEGTLLAAKDALEAFHR